MRLVLELLDTRWQPVAVELTCSGIALIVNDVAPAFVLADDVVASRRRTV